MKPDFRAGGSMNRRALLQAAASLSAAWAAGSTQAAAPARDLSGVTLRVEIGRAHV